MSLTDRQTAFYTDTVDIYVPSSLSIDGTTKRLTTDPKYPATPTYSNVKCMMCTTQENPMNAPPIGRSNIDNIFTMDTFRFDVAQDINDGYVIKLKTSGHPQINRFWVVVGGPENRISRGNRLANFAKVFAKSINKPQGIT